MSLEFKAMQWLKFEKNCPLVIMERSPRAGYCGLPDVLGITKDRYMLEIEIKRSVSDFRANAKKPHIRCREEQLGELSDRYNAMAPKQFWFLVPEKLVEKVLPEVPKWAGLLTEEKRGLKVIQKSPQNFASQKLSLKDCSRLMRNVGNQIYALMAAKESMIHGGYHIDPHANDKFYSEKLEYDGIKHKWVRNYDYLNFQI